MKFRLFFITYLFFFYGTNLSSRNSNILSVAPKPFHVTVSGDHFFVDKVCPIYVDSRSAIGREYITYLIEEQDIQTHFHVKNILHPG